MLFSTSYIEIYINISVIKEEYQYIKIKLIEDVINTIEYLNNNKILIEIIPAYIVDNNQSVKSKT